MPTIDRVDTAAANERVVVVPDSALILFRKCGLQPPTVGQLRCRRAGSEASGALRCQNVSKRKRI